MSLSVITLDFFPCTKKIPFLHSRRGFTESEIEVDEIEETPGPLGLHLKALVSRETVTV